MYVITTFAFINEKPVANVNRFLHWGMAVKCLEWALCLEEVEIDFKRLLIEDYQGIPLAFPTFMPGYENHPPIYLTIQYIP